MSQTQPEMCKLCATRHPAKRLKNFSISHSESEKELKSIETTNMNTLASHFKSDVMSKFLHIKIQRKHLQYYMKHMRLGVMNHQQLLIKCFHVFLSKNDNSSVKHTLLIIHLSVCTQS